MSKKRKWLYRILLGSALATAIAACSTMNLLRVDMLLSQEKYQEAIPILEGNIAKEPNSADSLARLGYAYLKTGTSTKAFDALNRARAAEPGNPYAIYYLGLAYLSQEDFDKALSLWREFKDSRRPIVEQEMKKLVTLIQIAASRKIARTAIAEEKKLQTVKTDPMTVAVCYYKDMSAGGKLAGFQKGLAAMVISDLSKIRGLRIVERLRMQALLEELKLGQTGIVDPGTAPRVGRLIGAENLVVGTLSGEILVATSLASSSTSKVKGSTATTIARESFFEIPRAIALDTARFMGVQLSVEEQKAVGMPLTKKFKAVVYYGQALDALDSGQWMQARNLFTLALQEDPQFILPKDGLESCPDEGSPSISQLAAMSTSDLMDLAETRYAKAAADQARKDREIAEMNKENDGGGGGGGGGH